MSSQAVLSVKYEINYLKLIFTVFSSKQSVFGDMFCKLVETSYSFLFVDRNFGLTAPKRFVGKVEFCT